MPLNNYILDLHAHVTLRAFNMFKPGTKRDIWHKTLNPTAQSTVTRWANIKTNDIAKESQSNLYAYTEGKTRVVLDSLYPIEREWFNFRRFPSFIMNKSFLEEILCITTGINKNRLRKLLEQPNYFDELNEYYRFLLNQEGTSPCKQYKLKLAGSFKEMNAHLNASQKNVVVIPCVEGAHSFGLTQPEIKKHSVDHLKQVFQTNIRKTKKWDHPPLYVTVAHHFWNHLCGHCPSFKRPVNFMFNQSEGLNVGITELGWTVIEELISNTNGKRILIDVKHMSLESRAEFYQFITRYNRINEDKIPVLCSHSAISGYETIEEAIKFSDKAGKHKENFASWSMNLSNEEIQVIHSSGGVIGILMDKAILTHQDHLNSIYKLPNYQQQEAFVKVVWDNIFGIIKAVGNPSAWEVPVLGSDYDGLINYLDPYENASKLPDLAQDMINYLEAHEYQQQLWYGQTPQELVNRIMNSNLFNFISKNY